MRIPILVMWVTSTLAILGVEKRIRWLQLVFKPLTTLLLFAVIGRPGSTFAWLVTAGVALSLIGDIALIWDGDRAFIIGLAAFLMAHITYVSAFLGVAVWSPLVAGVAVVVGATSLALVGATWKGAAAVRGPTIAYAAVISAMVVSAAATIGGPLPLAPFAAVGAVLFYASDSSLALNRFRRPIPYASLLTLGLYWLGQLGIACAAASSL